MSCTVTAQPHRDDGIGEIRQRRWPCDGKSKTSGTHARASAPRRRPASVLGSGRGNMGWTAGRSMPGGSILLVRAWASRPRRRRCGSSSSFPRRRGAPTRGTWCMSVARRSSSRTTSAKRPWCGSCGRCAHAEPAAHGPGLRRRRAHRHARLVRRARRRRASPRPRPGRRAPLPLPQQATKDREGALVRRLGLVRPREGRLLILRASRSIRASPAQPGGRARRASPPVARGRRCRGPRRRTPPCR